MGGENAEWGVADRLSVRQPLLRPSHPPNAKLSDTIVRPTIMKTEEFNPGVSFRVASMGYHCLCRVLANLPGVVFPMQRRLFWWGGNVGTEFTFSSIAFTVTTDEWDGALWVMTKDGQQHAVEMHTLRAGVESSKHGGGVVGRIWRQIVSETHT